MAPSFLVDRVADLLGQPITAWQSAVHGADHLVLIVRLQDGPRVVIKSGSEADVDAWVLPQLEALGVKAPVLLAQTEIEARGVVYPVIVMSFIEGMLLAEAPAPSHSYLPSLMAQIHRIHRITTERGAGPVMKVMRDQARSWKAYLLRVVTGEDPEFCWDLIQRDNRLDQVTLTLALTRVTELVMRLPEPERYSLLNGDLNPYNIFVDQHEVTGIVDWSYARFGDPLFDFARLRMNPFIRVSSRDPGVYFDELTLNQVDSERERTYYLFNLLEYVNWYYLDHEIERVRDQLRLLAQEFGN